VVKINFRHMSTQQFLQCCLSGSMAAFGSHRQILEVMRPISQRNSSTKIVLECLASSALPTTCYTLTVYNTQDNTTISLTISRLMYACTKRDANMKTKGITYHILRAWMPNTSVHFLSGVLKDRKLPTKGNFGFQGNSGWQAQMLEVDIMMI